MLAKRKIVYGYSNIQPAPADPYLTRAFKFNEYDLHFNQQGDLSDRQFQTLRQHRTFATCLVALIALVPLVMWFGLTREQPLWAQLVALGGVSAFICLPLFAIVWSFWSRYSRDMYDAPIVRATGSLALDLNTGRNGVYLAMKIDGQQFRLNKAQFLALKNRDVYTVYYTPNTRRLLSIAHEEDEL